MNESNINRNTSGKTPITTVYTTENSFTESITLENILRQLKMNEG